MRWREGSDDRRKTPRDRPLDAAPRDTVPPRSEFLRTRGGAAQTILMEDQRPRSRNLRAVSPALPTIGLEIDLPPEDLVLS